MTYLEDFKSKFSKSNILDTILAHRVCREELYGIPHSDMNCLNIACLDCWNREMDE